MSFLISIHNILRWFILLGIILILIQFIVTYIQFKSNKFEIQEFITNSKKNIMKWFRVFTILVNIQFILGFFIYILNPYIIEAWNHLKEREIRFIMLEHPFLMIIFVGLTHVINSKIKKLEFIKQYKTIFILYMISIVVLLAGIPWFRPLIRF